MTEKQALDLILKQLEVSIAYRELFAEECVEQGRADAPLFQSHVEILEGLDVSSPYVIQRQLREIKDEAQREADRHKTDDGIRERMLYSPEERIKDHERANARHEAISTMMVAQTELTFIDMFVGAIE